jgi:predicted MPP superfamily phosphohydrolase
VLAHDPFWFAHLPAGPYLMLAGHTHGGQIRFPVVGALRNGSRAPMRWSHGHIEEGGRHLYVSAGLGTSGIPLRIGMPPEYAIVDVAGS